MSLPDDIQTFLLTRTLITNLVGQRVYNGKTPQDAASPYIVYREVVGQSEDDLADGTSLSHPLVQIDGWTRTPSQLKSLRAAIRSIKGYTGAVGSTTVRHIHLVSGPRHLIEPPDGAGDESWQAYSFDFDFWHEETVPA